MSRIAATFARLKRAGPQGADSVHHRRRSRSGEHRAADACAGCGRRRYDRTRRAVFRSDGGRPGHPAFQRARAASTACRCDTCSVLSREFRKTNAAHAGGADGLCQSDRGDGRRRVCRHAAQRSRRRRRAGGRLSAGGGASRWSALLDARGIDTIFLLAPTTTRRAHRAGGASSGAAISITFRCNGVTGAANLDLGEVAQQHRRTSARITKLPVGVGFGIRDGKTAQRSRRDRRRGGHRQPAGQEIESSRRGERAMRQHVGAGRRYPRSHGSPAIKEDAA